jgi:hypothetical protein
MGVCKHDGFTKRPLFNTPGEKAGLYCAAHKLNGMVNVMNKVCQHDDCTKQPYFNTPGEKAGLFCATHRLVGMVDVKGRKRAAAGASGEGGKKPKLAR